jgi:hypothetical protein
MLKRPEKNEADPYYFTYINRVPAHDVTAHLSLQLDQALPVLQRVSEEKSFFRYTAEKWSIRQVLSHITDTERVFLFRALWFARGLDTPLPSFDQDVAVTHAGSENDGLTWQSLVEEFRLTRLSTHSFFRNLPLTAWSGAGLASGKHVTVRALAYIIAGHCDHHLQILHERYLGAGS